jgi:hypothetical protein
MAEFPNVAPQENEKGIEYEGYNGWFNNRGKHDLGAVGKILIIPVFIQYSPVHSTSSSTKYILVLSSSLSSSISSIP